MDLCRNPDIPLCLALLDHFPIGWRVLVDLVELVIDPSDSKWTQTFHNKYKFSSNNPSIMPKYFFYSGKSRLQEKQRMLNQAHLNKLFSDGVHKDDYTAHKDWFQVCSECCTKFSKDRVKPNLLQCGHVCCDVCLNDSGNTACIGCHSKNLNVKKTPKIRGYETLLKNDNLQENGALYDFVVQINSNSINVKDKNGITTFKQILQAHEDYITYQKTINFKVAVVVNKKTYYAENIKGKMISELESQARLVPKKNNRSNMIKINDRSLGGHKITTIVSQHHF